MSQRNSFPPPGDRVQTSSLPFNIAPGPLGTGAAAVTSSLSSDGAGYPQVGPAFRGEALARIPGLERTGGWIVLSFTIAFAIFLLLMRAAGQVPGQSFPLKSISDFLQFAGEGIGFIFCITITLRLRATSVQLARHLRQIEFVKGQKTSEKIAARNEVQSARRSFLAWLFLSIAIAVYASGQAIWTSYDVRMASSAVPFPGLYDIGFVSSYPFFVIGALLLVRQGNRRAMIGRVRLLLDAFAVIGAALALSWFFILQPSIATLAQQPSQGAAFLTLYFPGGDLLLVALGAFLMFSQFSTREQQPVFIRLCLGLFFLAVTDSLLVWLSLSFSFNTGTVQDVLWPLSMQMVGLAAIAYPRAVALEEERTVREASQAGETGNMLQPNRLSAFGLSIQTATPFLLALGTCALLLTVVPSTNKSNLIAADLIALALFVLVAIRQGLTLNENNLLRLQLAGELVVSRRELHVTRRAADVATREIQEKQRLEQGISALQEVHARIAAGDFSARASTDPGPLQTVAVSLNLVVERLKELAGRANKYDQLLVEIKYLQEALDHLGRGTAPWPPSTIPSIRGEMRPLFLGVERTQRFQLNQWKSLLASLERIVLPLGRVRAVLNTPDTRGMRAGSAPGGIEGTVSLVTQQIEQQLQRLIEQIRALIEQLEGHAAQDFSVPSQANPAGQVPFAEPQSNTSQTFTRSPYRKAGQGEQWSSERNM